MFISPFLTKIGIDTQSLIDLNTKKTVFVEGFHDLILLNAACIQLMENAEYEYLNQIIFIPLGSSTKISSVVNISIAFNKSLPYFIFDYDKAGEKGVKLFKKNGFIDMELKNFTYINGLVNFAAESKKIEIQNIFDDTLFEGNKISKYKNTKNFIDFSIKVKSKEISWKLFSLIK